MMGEPQMNKLEQMVTGVQKVKSALARYGTVSTKGNKLIIKGMDAQAQKALPDVIDTYWRFHANQEDPFAYSARILTQEGDKATLTIEDQQQAEFFATALPNMYNAAKYW